MSGYWLVLYPIYFFGAIALIVLGLDRLGFFGSNKE